MVEEQGDSIRQTVGYQVDGTHAQEGRELPEDEGVACGGEAEGELVIETCCICSLPSDDGFDHPECYVEGSISASEVDDD